MYITIDLFNGKTEYMLHMLCPSVGAPIVLGVLRPPLARNTQLNVQDELV